MSMSMGDMPAGSMSMGNGVPSLFTLQKMYWAVVGSVIGAATLVNVLDRVLAGHRLRDSSLTPAKPKSLFFNIYATLTATTREVSYATLRPLRLGGWTLHFPPLGPVLIMLANLVAVMVLCFYKLDTLDPWAWENVGYRTGFIAVCQLPLIFLLAGRQNIIGLLAGMSYVSLNWYHRWVARTLWLTTTIHMAFWFRNWARWNYITYQLSNDPLTKRGFAAWVILTFIVITSFGPIRRLSYEFFVIQHLVTFIGFIVAVWMHAPDEVKIWVWIPIGLVVFDRLARYAWGAYANLAIFHRNNRTNALWQHSATFTPLPGNVTCVTIENPSIRWEPGQHVFLTCHTVAPLQCHPFTIASIPEDNKMKFFIRAENGGTRRFFRYASKSNSLLGDEQVVEMSGTTVFVEGPYGSIRPLRQFDSVILLAGGMGATFTIPLLRDVVSAWKMESTGSKEQMQTHLARLTATKRLRFVWVIKSRSQLAYFDSELHSLLADVSECRCTHSNFDKEIEISIYITCDEKLDPPVSVSLPLQQTQPPPTMETLTQHETKNLSEKDNISIHSVSAESASTPGPVATGRGCLPGGGCCCTAQIKDEEISAACACNCSGPAAVQSVEATVDVKFPESEDSKSKAILYPNIVSGRPTPRTIIRKVLEKAQGESAVVVCGPRGLADDVRRSVVSLSDERAVHKGTGAQGIYLHVENFGL
ncbi:Riboflavin synthase-like beta-barrel [Penicillium cf. griseofulvum]|uniref:ferric-chelate reductase (NADPH) n=1 Tax=Penicillium cf. griseofulvum TaxID=2972120 RepID=A0A9W9JCF1_9EURO|nr:Riboflavin synthase-like beta-barrel [Penicillium cf. griseofulvum]KAJ5445615.1 Riboflavin synthase-like beta-barrel [Penicillium cf. griseofulvum]